MNQTKTFFFAWLGLFSVMNDEHTNRKYIPLFLLGWGFPAFFVGIFYLVLYNLVKYYFSSLDETFVYGDVHDNAKM